MMKALFNGIYCQVRSAEWFGVLLEPVDGSRAPFFIQYGSQSLVLDPTDAEVALAPSTRLHASLGAVRGPTTLERRTYSRAKAGLARRPYRTLPGSAGRGGQA